MLTLVEGGELHAPRPLGQRSLLTVGERIGRIGAVDRAALDRLGLPYEVVDATGCLVVPGFVDPHQHLLGGGGEQGFGTREPEVSLEEIVCAGITTVVGCLGTDTTTRTLAGLLGKVRELEARGITAYMHTGGFPIPPKTITDSVTDDLVMIDRVIGIGEIAIADYRSTEPSLLDLAKVVSAGILGGLLSGKAGVSHFHVADGGHRLGLLRDLVDQQHVIPPKYLYPTHVSRTPELLAEAVDLAARGCYVDIDTIGEEPDREAGAGPSRDAKRYLELGGPPEQLTFSSDAHTPGGKPEKVHAALVACVREQNIPLETALGFVTRNPAAALQLGRKGELAEGKDGDVLVLDAATLAVRHVVARGRLMVRDGRVVEPKEEGA